MNKLSLESRINAEVYNFSGRIGLYANDFKGNIIEINSDDKFETASTIKVFVLAELYKQIHENKINPHKILEYEKENYVVGSGILRDLDYGVEMTAKSFATLMIIISDNIATNVLIDLLGIDNINNTCADLGLKDTILHNKIDFEKYSKLGTTTPRDYGRFFELLYKKELWSKEISEEMIDILKKQHYNTILTRDLPQYFLDSENTGDEELISIASKSGSMDACRNDGGIVYTPYGGYVISLFTKDFVDNLYYNDHESYRFGGKVSRLMFDQYISLEGRFK
ncbi:class A beta-lactamase-related serine hydrolase [Tissierella carlieri]|uniref:Class A beta-lactamase-related serine hydrolase n=1 Tax=Tissierella carlieri TaxID=689904 RepID=A0ABT1S7L7_9FIRM|nr:class A beta-lactamase-related serine hydrolase [Tissierella carlieri]MCQ4922458.1 class A beta-lactamase-related serine hydrolase [Tissierella carlieri]